ncbi:MAG: hypothetical protein NVSMB68_04580 [Thermoanaerobaculia bacterium]
MKNILLGVVLFAAAGSASASIAVFTDGRTMKIDTYKVEDGVVQMTLRSGGVMSMPIQRIDRIVEDEVVPVVPPPIVDEVQKAVKKVEQHGVFPKRSWRYDASSKPLFKTRFDGLISEAARHFDVDAALISAVIKAESDYNPREVSNKGARGLMQLMPSTAQRFGVSNSFDPTANVYAGTRYLRWLLQTFDGNADMAVAAYNAGEGNVWKYNGVPPFHETLTYIRRIAKHFPPAVVAAVPPARR